MRQENSFYGYGWHVMLWTIVLLLASTWGCSTTEQVDKPVATVGNVHISGEQLRRFALDVLPDLRPAKQGQAARQDYLQTLIDRQLMLHEAANLNLENESAVRVKLLHQRRIYLATLYRQQKIHPKAQVTASEIEAFFREQGLARERLVTAIWVETLDEARELLKKLAAGAVFEELAARHTLDPRVAERGGELGFMNRSMARRLGVPSAIFDNQEEGVVSSPLPLGEQFHLVRFIGEREGDVGTQRELLSKGLTKAKKLELEQEEVELLAYELGWKIVPEGLSILQTQAEALVDSEFQLAKAERQSPLFLYTGGQVPIDEYLEVLKKFQINNIAAFTDSVFIDAYVRSKILPELMLTYAAERDGISVEPGISERLSQAAEEALLKAVYHHQVGEAITVTDEEVKRYIATNADKFMTPERICFDELIAPDLKGAQEVKESLLGAEDWVGLATKKGFKLRPRNEDGLVCMHSLNRQPYPHLWRGLQMTSIGEVGGPVETREGFVLFKVLTKQAPKPEPEVRVGQRARASLVQRAEQQRFDQWVGSLRAKYQNQVTVFEVQLEAALPEALLASLVRESQDN